MPARQHAAGSHRHQNRPSSFSLFRLLPKITLSSCFTTIFILYLAHSLYSIYQIYYPKACRPTEKCIQPSWKKDTKFDVSAFVSTASEMQLQNLVPVWTEKSMDLSERKTVEVNVTLPMSTINNGSLYLHLLLSDSEKCNQRYSLVSRFHYDSQITCLRTSALTKFVVPKSKAFNLLKSEEKTTKPESKEVNPQDAKPVTHWIPRMSIHVMSEPIPIHGISHEMVPFFQIDAKKQYLPIIYIDHFGLLEKDFLQVNASSSIMPLTLAFTPVSYGKMHLILIVDYSLKMLINAGFSEKDTDDVKAIFFDTNIYLLFLTFIVSGFHLLFDLLSFKNDISFWRKRTSNVGISFRSLLWRCISQTLIFIYLYDQGTSLVVLGPAAVSIIIELWKVTKALKVKFVRDGWSFGIQFGASTEEEKLSDTYDSEGMKYLIYIVSPCCVLYAIYSLLYVQHRSWFSWCIESVVNGAYAFGFIFMLPQLFVNYKLKSVAHLPWRVFMYKAFNTVIDDLFAFIITMPTAHRVACFRDDVVFLIYLYQRWLYPVDSSRQTEYFEPFSSGKQEKDKRE